jgi:hypothetical protein
MHNREIIGSLLKDELSAMETYQQVMNQFRNDASFGETESLLPLYKGHKEAVSSLQAQIREYECTHAETSSVWGSWAQIFQGCAILQGKQAMLKILQVGEKNSKEAYEKVLQNTKLATSIRCLIEWKLLFIQQSHIRTLDRLMDTAA